MADRLHRAKLMGADVIVDGKTENLKEAGLYIVHRTDHWFINQQPHLKVITRSSQLSFSFIFVKLPLHPVCLLQLKLILAFFVCSEVHKLEKLP